MSYIVNRTNEKGESLTKQLSTIHGMAKSISRNVSEFGFFERVGSVDTWLKQHREWAKEILARLDKIEGDFIERFEDEEGE